MPALFSFAGRWTQLRAPLLAVFVLASACDRTDELASPTAAGNLLGDSAATVSDSVRIADSVRVADSLLAADSLGLGDSLAVDTESFTAAAIHRSGMRFASYDCTTGGLAAYNVCNRSAGSWTANELKGLRGLGAGVILNQGGYGRYKDRNGRYNPTKYYNWVKSLRKYAPSWKPYLANGTLRGVQLIDDRLAGNWGGRAISNAQVDQMAKWWKQLLPGITTFVSGGYAENLLGYRFRYLDGSINQYNARYMGDVKKWRDKSVAAARRANTSIILSLNVLDGGKIYRGCHHGGSSKTCSMTPAELRRYGAALAAAPAICGLGTWKYRATYHARPGVLAGLKYISALAARRSDVSCKKR
jgi:hypothetical protein